MTIPEHSFARTVSLSLQFLVLSQQMHADTANAESSCIWLLCHGPFMWNVRDSLLFERYEQNCLLHKSVCSDLTAAVSVRKVESEMELTEAATS